MAAEEIMKVKFFIHFEKIISSALGILQPVYVANILCAKNFQENKGFKEDREELKKYSKGEGIQKAGRIWNPVGKDDCQNDFKSLGH